MVQLRYATNLSPEEYVRQEAWKDAVLEQCPLHAEGGCGFGKNGAYSRKFPDGAKIARWYCRLGRTTFSLLPDCLASRFSGSLDEIEAVVLEVEDSTSQAAAAETLRPHIELSGALRWIRRRALLIRTALAFLIEICPLCLADCEPAIISFRNALGFDPLLPSLRDWADMHLHLIPPPLGFGPHPQRRQKNYFQHKAGTEPPARNRYDCS